MIYAHVPRPAQQTNADRIRAMSDEELARILLRFNGMEEPVPFCKNLPECDELLETEEGVPESKCLGCALDWLHCGWENPLVPGRREDDHTITEMTFRNGAADMKQRILDKLGLFREIAQGYDRALIRELMEAIGEMEEI